MNKGLILLSGAIFFEQTGCVLMKVSDGFSKLNYSIFGILTYLVSLIFFNFSLKFLDLSFVCATWSALSITISTILGLIIFGEEFNPIKIVWTSVCLIGVLGLINASK